MSWLSPETVRFIAVVGSVLMTTCGGWFFAIRWALSRNVKHIDSKFDEIAKQIEAQTGETQRLSERVHQNERELLEFRAKVAENYIAREDWARHVTQMSIKMDGITERLESISLRVEMIAHGSSGKEAA